MRLRYAGTCCECGTALPAGTEAIYDRTTKTVHCIECPSGAAAAVPDSGSAGASARREHERRKTAREERVRADHPRLGGLILALTDDPQSTRAWEGGAIGEEIMANRLTDLPESFRLLHDRRIPGTRANIDHIVVGPTGVWVIDAKRYKDRRPSLHVEGGIIRPRVESLRIGGRDGTKLVDGVRGQVEKVASVSGEGVPVTGVLCFVEADWPMIGGSFTVNDFEVVWPRLLVKGITEASTVPIDVDAVHARLAAHFRMA